MSPDTIEQRLRERLQGAVESQYGSFLDVDPTEALDTGLRIARRRRVAAVAGTAAAALALGIGSLAVLADRPDDRSLPATTQTVTGESVTLQLGVDARWGPSEPIETLVTVDPASGEVDFRLETASGVGLASDTRKPRGREVAWTVLASNVMAAVIPAEAAAFVPVWSSFVTEDEAALEVLPDGRVAAAWRTDVPATGTLFAGVVWTDGETAFTAAGLPLDTVVEDDVVIFANTTSGAWGYVRPDSRSPRGTGAIRQALEQDVGEYPGVWAPDTTGESGVYAAYLPMLTEAEREQVSLVTKPGAVVRDLSTHRPDHALFVVAHVEGPPDSVRTVRFPNSDTYPKFTPGFRW
jgi:hypothetical protein